jgi:tetratricopeptide (TPR) repeat protein
MKASSNPRGHRAWVEGNQLFTKGRYPDAIIAFTEAIRYDPHQAGYYHNRAVARAALDDADGAIEDLWRAIELDSRSSDTRFLMDALHSAMGHERPGATRPNPAVLVQAGIGTRPPYVHEELGKAGTPIPSSAESRPQAFDRLKKTDVPPIELLKQSLRTE